MRADEQPLTVLVRYVADGSPAQVKADILAACPPNTREQP